MKCSYRLSLGELLSRPAVELRLVGADGEDDKGTGNGAEGGSGGEGEDDKSKPGEGGDDKSGGKKAEPSASDKKISYLEEEKERHYELRKAAEAELQIAKDKIAKLEKDGTTDEETKQKVVTLERENSGLTEKNKALRIENAFLKSNTHKWKDNAVALKLADLSRVELDDKTGDAHGLQAALDKLATESPYLLETEDTSEGKSKKPPVKTGDKTGDKGDKDKASTQAKRASLEKRFPGIRRA